MRISQRTRHGSISMGPVGWLAFGMFVGPLYLMWLMLVGAVRLAVWIGRQLTAPRPAVGTRLTTPTRRH